MKMQNDLKAKGVRCIGEPPLVSVCIPTYNTAGMIKEAITSVLKQTYQPIEIWVMDNCSTDATESVVKAMVATEPRIKYVRHANNLGMARNFNACLSAATGDMVLILGADDSLKEECVDRLANALYTHESAVLAGCARQFVDEAMNPIAVMSKVKQARLIDGTTLMRECVAFGNKIGEPSAVLFRREPANRGFNVEFNQFLDLEMWFYLANRGSGIFLPEPLSVIRQHAQQTSKANFLSGRLIEEKRRLFLLVFSRASVQLTLGNRMMWDLRMAVSIARFKAVGGRLEVKSIREVYFRPLFLIFAFAVRAAFAVKRIKGALSAHGA